MIFVEKHIYSFLFLSFIALFLFSCGGGGSNSDQTPLDSNANQNTEVNNSSQDTVSVALEPVTAQIEVVNRFGKCNFGECRFD